jgi:hypothetical protein
VSAREYSDVNLKPGYGERMAIRNRTAGHYSDAELRQLVEAASAGLTFSHRIRITFSITRPRFRRKGERGRTFHLAHLLSRTREIEVWIPANRAFVVPPSQTWAYPGLSRELLRKGYLNRPGMTGVELPLFVTAHELCHAAEPRITFARSKKPANETAADNHALRILDGFRKRGGRFDNPARNRSPVDEGPQ